MKNPKVSVIIPAYNEEKTLPNCLKSVLNQNFSDYEIIVINNNSTDNTEKIIKELMKNHKKLRYVFEKNKGRGFARNKGILAAKGEIILMTDSDCIVPNNWIKEMIKPIINENESIVMGFEKDLIKNFWTLYNQKAIQRFFGYIRNGKYINHIDTKNISLKTHLAKKILFDPNLKNCEDFDFYLRVRDNMKIRFLPDLRVGHFHKSNMIKTIKLQFNRGYWVYQIYLKHKKNPRLLKEPTFESFTFKNNLKFLIEFLVRPFITPSRSLFFRFIFEGSWRLALFYCYINSK
jgi:glycosyltransferase involved in cell wall biosynthesis